MALVSCVFSSALAGAPKVQSKVAARANMNVQAYVGPYRYVVGATVTVRDQAGNTLARGKTSTRGRAALQVSGRPSVKAPYAVSVTGGTVRGKRFTGTLTTHVGSVPKRFKLTRIDYATTAASKMPGANSGRFQPNLMRVMKTLGFVTRGPFGWRTTEPLKYHSYQVGDASLSRMVRWVGGYDALTTRLAKISSAGRRIPGLRTKVLQLPNQNYRRRSRVGSPLPCKAPASRSKKTGKCVPPAKGRTARSMTKSEFQTTSSGTASVGNAPCQSSYAPPPSASSTQFTAAADFGLETFAGLLSVAVTGSLTTDSLALGEGVTGYAMTEMNASVDSSGGASPQLSDIQSQLTCISQQLATIDTYLADIYDAVEIGTLQTILSRANTCQTNITDAYDYYTQLVDNAALAPGSYGYAPLDSSNTSLAADISSWQTLLTACGSGIDEMLFPPAASGEVGGWEQAVFEAQTGVFNTGDTAGLTPSTTSYLQNFLAYWSTLEYQQSVIWNEYYNYQANILSPAAPQAENQQIALGWTTTASNPYGTCQQTASVSNVTSGTSSGCQWQQNIADVWPGTQYSDEVGQWGTTAPSAASTNSLSGLAISAVPYGLGTSSSVNPANVGTGEMVTPHTIAEMCFGDASNQNGYQPACSSTLSGYSASNALSSFNGVSTGTYQAPYQAWFAPQVDKTAALGSGYNLTALNGFFNQQLNATAGSSSTGPVLGSSTSPSWQVVASDNAFSANTSNSCGGNCGATQYSAQVVATSAQNLVSPWVSGDGQTITTTTTNSQFPSNALPTAPAAAYLLSRPWTQGAAWPTAPQFGNFVGTAPVVQLTTVSGCPSAGCTWAWGPSGPPSGFSSSSLTAAGVLTIPNGVTAPSTITVVASNNVVATPPTSVDLLLGPGTLNVGFPGTTLAAGTSWQLLYGNECGSGCTWALATSADSVFLPGASSCTNGVFSGYTGAFTLSQSGVLTATEAVSSSDGSLVCAVSTGSGGAITGWGIYVDPYSAYEAVGYDACTTSADFFVYEGTTWLYSYCYLPPLTG